VTRYLIYRFLKRPNYWKLVLDVFLTYTLFLSFVCVLVEAPWIIVGLVEGFESGSSRLAGLASGFGLFKNMYIHQFEEFLIYSKWVDYLGQDITGYFISSFSTLLPEWYYILSLAVMKFLSYICKISAKFLELLARWPKELCTYIFYVISILYVIFAWVYDYFYSV
jgi:hypothetical protein